MIKITSPEIIQKRERELLDGISGSLDRDTLVEVLKDRHRLHSISGMESRHGDLVAVGNMVAYRLDFDVRTVLSVLFDRSGNYVELSASDPAPVPGDISPKDPSTPPGSAVERADAPSEEAKKPKEGESGEYLSLDQILTTKADMITDSQPAPERKPKAEPGERMSQLASDLADMITEINGKKTR